jgi:ABC-2 type transport system permease protein
MTTTRTENTASALPRPVTANGPGARPRQVAPVSFPRLVQVELRKLADTRAGIWLLSIIGLAAAVTTVIMLFAVPEEEQSFSAFFSFAQLPAGILLPVLGILSMTSEWSQKTALATFTLVPRRGRVIAAKLVAAAAIAVVAALSGLIFAAAGNVVAGGPWTIEWALIGQAVLLQVTYVLMGSAFGALLMNSPLAIVAFFALPMIWTMLGAMISSLRDVAAWLDLNTTTGPLSEIGMTGGEWQRFGVSAAVWVLVPLIAGTIRVIRREVS